MIRLINTAVTGFAVLVLFAAISSCKVSNPEPAPSASEAVELGTAVNNQQTEMTKAPLANHHPLPVNTKIRVRACGVWNGHEPSDIVKTTVGTALADTDSDNINKIDFPEGKRIYWDDFGVGDPGNTYGRNLGLTIYAAGVFGSTTAPEIYDWSHFPWSVDKAGTTVLEHDFIYANNISEIGTGTYKYDSRDAYRANLLDMEHAMSQVVFNITAGEGFPTSGVGVTPNRFQTDPVVLMTSNRPGETSHDEYCLCEGHINIVSDQVHADATSNDRILAQTTSLSDPAITVVKQALVFPGSRLGRMNPTDLVAIITADGNNYYLTAAKMRAAMLAEDASTNYTTKAGYTYIFNVIISKTQIHVTASVQDWVVVNSELEHMQVKFNADVVTVTGTSGTPVTTNGASFSLYRSQTSTLGSVATTPTYNSTSGKWENTPAIYWPNGTDSFYFRALAESDATTTMEARTSNTVTQAGDDVLWGTTSAHTGYEDDGTTSHTYAEGALINPRTGDVPMLFKHAATLLSLNLYTSTDPDKAVVLTGATIDITNLYTSGTLNVYDESYTYGSARVAAAIPGASSKNYPVASTTVLDSYLVIPQTITDASKVTVTLADGTKYSIQLNKCKIKDSTTLIDTWSSGHHYIYEIYLEKEDISFSAMVQDWTVKYGEGTADLDWD